MTTAAGLVPSASGLLDELDPAQRQAAQAVQGPVCILAGAGTGKTRTITHRIANQVASGVARPEQVLAVTFTERAARELRERLGRLGIASPIRTATFHSAAWAQLRYFWPRVASTPVPEVLSSKLRLLAPAARRLHVEAVDLAAEIEWAKARGLGPDAYAEQASGRRTPLAPGVIAQVYDEYETAKTEANLIDYGDMLLLMTRLLTDREDIAAEVRQRYRFFTVDEFQDVNPAQWGLLRAWLGDRDEVCVVGDDDQMIYSFAGASAAYLTGFTRRFPHAQTVTLTTSYRSTPQILQLANAVLPPKPAELAKELTATRPDGPRPRFHEADDPDEEVDEVVRSIRELVDEGTPPREIAVCYRVNSQSRAYEQALADADVPCIVRGDAGFFDRAEIRQALGVLQAAAGQDVPGPRGVEEAPAVGDARPASPRRPDRLVESVLRDKLSFHPRREPAGEAARDRWRNLTALCELASMMVQADPDVTLADVVAEMRERAAHGQETARPEGAVTLCTLHRAKGLEFDAVFLVGLEEGLVPISHARSEAEVAEERRLLYVGVTRARHHLALSWARSRPGRDGKAGTATGKRKARRPSRFLSDLGPGAPGGNRPPSTAARAGRGASPEPADDACTTALREWRKDRAARDGQPAFVVFSNRTLAELARRRPTTPEELLAVPGLGPAKVRRYGDELLALLRGG